MRCKHRRQLIAVVSDIGCWLDMRSGVQTGGNMLSSLWLPPMVAVVMAFGPGGALADSASQNASSAHQAVTAQAARSGAGSFATQAAAPAARTPDLGRLLRLAASEPAPLVTDSVLASTGKTGLASTGKTGLASTGKTGLPDPGKAGLPTPAVSAAMARANAIRQTQALSYLRHTQPAVAKELIASQQPQVRNYFCGPAAVSEMLAQMKVTLPQPAAARELGTTPGGTDWSDAGGYPVPKVLNANQKPRNYGAVGLPWTPTAAQIKTFEVDLVTDINHGPGVPIAGNAYEVPGGPHLVGHPPGQTIMHWFDIRGYSKSGAVTDYEDSVHGAASIGWSAAVPAYSALASATIVNIVGARGYVW